MKSDKGSVGGSTILLLLSLLKEEDRYGYGIIKEFKLRCDKTFHFNEGKLYPVLHKLVNKGYVKSYLAKNDKGKERKYYHITRKGKKQLKKDEEKWEMDSIPINKVADDKLNSTSKKEKFLEEVMGYIKFPFDRDDIKFELKDHILEKINYYIAQGYDKETAEQLSIRDMGYAKEMGIKLNKQHNPLIGWIWKITNVMIIVFLLFNIYFIGGTTIMTLFDSNPVNEIPKSNIDYRIDMDKKVKLDDTVIHFTNIIYEKNGNMNIFYEYYDTKLWGTGWSLGGIGEITDDLGNTYLSGSGGGSGGIKSKCIKTVKNFSQEADRLIINYDIYNRKYKVEIPLHAGDKNE
ncbi:MAG: PadR family transcriptional regulator [Firmicutes bacterium]|nr:PadR family transcriptional regulator [Bacillota bacterium]